MIFKNVTSMKKAVFYGLLLFVSLHGMGQANPNNFQKMVDFLPPAPNASAIIKYDALSINKNNGSPSISIPIFTVKGNKLSANISIGYSSTGLKVDEIASRVGMGWSLNAGGVVTRTVRGVPDEWNTRITPYSDPIQQNCGNYSFMSRVASSLSCNSQGCNGWDAEPDLFNFSMNGQSGSFVYDGNGNPVLIPSEKYKIQKNLGGSAWDFIITDNAGIEYYFGGTGAIEKTKRLSNCGKNFDAYIANTWYLVKIKHPNGETINLTYVSHNYTYDNGVNETQHWAYWMTDYDGQNTNPDPCYGVTCPICPAAPPTTKCVNITSTQGVLLNTIICDNDIVRFTYQTRKDCTDKLVFDIKHYNNIELKETVNFFYNEQLGNNAYVNETTDSTQYYTPYLTDLQRMSSDYVFTNTHRFVYNDPGARPPRLSFAQDHWGYFNGKVNIDFIPKPTDFALQTKFPVATANREPDPAFASKGILNKIVYPSGGIDYIDYEPNEVNDQITGPATYQTAHEYNCSVTGTGFPNPTQNTKSTSFTIDKAQYVELLITCSTTDPGSYDSTHMKGSVEVTGASSTILYEFFNAGSPGTQYIRYLNPTWSLAPGTYTLTYGAKGIAQSTTVKMKFYPVETASVNVNKMIGGVRVKRIMTGNPGEKPTIRRFYYANMDALNISSMSSTRWPKYYKPYRNTMQCTQYCGVFAMPTQAYCDLAAMYSGSLVSLFNYGSGLISYGSVIESAGENFEGGATQSKFYVGPDGAGQAIWGDDILDAPLSNFSSILNGKISEEIVFKKPTSGPLFPIRKTLYTYLIDQRQQNLLYGYNVRMKYNFYGIGMPGSNCPPNTIVDPRLVNSFDIVKYSIISYWTHPESVTETIYDENGQNPITTVNNSFYDNDQHFQLTRSETLNSKNELLKTTNTYPPDFPNNAVYAAMTAKNIITPLITSKSDNGTSELSLSKINYGDVGNNNFVPVSVEKSAKGNALEIEGTITLYDASGNILEFTGKNEVVTAIIWGYNNKYPVAQVVGASYSNAIAQLTNGSVAALQSMDGATLRTELHRIRTGITTASVTTYTYKVMTGVTSITDPNNKTNTYDYDSFNRLLTIKDQDGNVVKKNQYIYAGSSASSALNVFFNAPRTKDYQCQTCTSGYIDNTVYHYYIPYGKYYSLINQAAVEALAVADNDGQEYANKNGKCINYVTATCTGPDYKVVNCICEQGMRICEYSTPDGNGGWLAHLHLHWSDGSVSPSFTDYIASCTGINKKFLNCVCETGTKVCDGAPVNNGGGSYTVSYHYHFSDNTNSTVITETITCSGPDKKMIGCTCETGWKMCLSSVYCDDLKDPPAGCCPGKWLNTFKYRFSDGSFSAVFTECSTTSCFE